MFPNPGAGNIARIAQKRRTSSCRTAVLLMGDSPQVFPGAGFKERKMVYNTCFLSPMLLTETHVHESNRVLMQ